MAYNPYDIALKQAELRQAENKKRAYDDMMRRMAEEGAAKASGKPIKPETSDALAGHYTRIPKTTTGGTTTAGTKNTTPATTTAGTPTAGNGNTGGGGRKKTTGGTTTTTSTASYSGGGYDGGDGGGGGYVEPVNPYANALALLEQNYNTAVKSVKDRYGQQIKKLRSTGADQLREAYINYMLNKQNAANDMARQGYTGGLVESNLAKLYNNYGTIRNDINKRVDESVDNYNAKKNQELLSLLMNYNNQKAKYSL